MKIGVFIGRFQPFHNAHLDDVRKISEEVEILHIGIGSAQEKGAEDNPFSFAQRKEMIALALKEAKIRGCRFFAVDDVHDDVLWAQEIERKLHLKNRRSEVCVYSGNDWTLRCFKKIGYPTKKIELIGGISGSTIRAMRKKGEKWEALVPKAIEKYIKEHELK